MGVKNEGTHDRKTEAGTLKCQERQAVVFDSWELQVFQLAQLLWGSTDMSNPSFVIPFLAMIVTYATYIGLVIRVPLYLRTTSSQTSIMKQALTASTVFSSMAVFKLFRLELCKVLLAVPLVVSPWAV